MTPSISPHHLVAQMIEHTSRREGWKTPLPVAAPAGDPEASIGLPVLSELPLRTVADVITSRHSGPIYESGIDTAQLGALLSAWDAKLPSALLPDSLFATQAFPVALDVRGLPTAAYRYDISTRRLLRIRPVTRVELRRDVLLQWEHGNAAVVIFFVAPLSRWLCHFGDRGYRSVAMQAGWITDRLYLIAETLRLRYTASGGYAPARADRLLGLDGYHYTAFFSFVVSGAQHT
jgi:SagB-type dehydrogenase family enzyme